MALQQRGLFLTGTDTNVGKTRIGVALARRLRAQGLIVCPRKPVESGCEDSPQGLLPRDGVALRDAAGGEEPLDRVCPFTLRAALSPARAAQLEGRELHIAQLAAACTPSDPQAFLLVEGAGGFYSPLTQDGLNADLAQQLALPVLLVVANRLGCINHALLSAQAIDSRGLMLRALVLNQTEIPVDEAMNNAGELRARLQAPVFETPYLDDSAQQDPPVLAALTDCVIGR